MRSKIIFVVLLMLSFSAFHDTFISIIDKSEHKSIVHYMSDEVPSSECAEFNELHNMFHFMAIVNIHKDIPVYLVKVEKTPHLLRQYASPLKETSYKPPIA